jgi:hypothetical protein
VGRRALGHPAVGGTGGGGAWGGLGGPGEGPKVTWVASECKATRRVDLRRAELPQFQPAGWPSFAKLPGKLTRRVKVTRRANLTASEARGERYPRTRQAKLPGEQPTRQVKLPGRQKYPASNLPSKQSYPAGKVIW